MSNVIQFPQAKDVSGWPIKRILAYMKSNGWKNFKLYMNHETGRVRIERTA